MTCQIYSPAALPHITTQISKHLRGRTCCGGNSKE